MGKGLNNEDAKSNQGLKKPYAQPILRVYGVIWDLTKAVGMGSSMDGSGPGSSNSNKTH
jgi:hypothetical protein